MNVAGFPVFIPDAPWIEFNRKRVYTLAWRGSGNQQIEAYQGANYPDDYDRTGHVIYGYRYEFGFLVPGELAQGVAKVRLRYMAWGTTRSSAEFTVDFDGTPTVDDSSELGLLGTPDQAPEPGHGPAI